MLLTKKFFLFSTIFYHLLLICSLLSCKDVRDSADYTKMKTIKIDDSIFSKNIKLPIDSSSIKYVKLETTDQSRFSRISQIKCYRDRIYVLDQFDNKLLIFGITGKFLAKVTILKSKFQNFDIFKDKIYISEKRNSKIYQLDLNGFLLKSLNIGFYGGQFAVLEEESFLFVTLGLRTDNVQSQIYEGMIYTGGKSFPILPYRNRYRGLKYIYGNQISRLNSDLYFLTAFKHILYRVDKEKVLAVTKFDFGSYNLPDSVFLTHSTYKDYNRTPYVSDLAIISHMKKYTIYKFSFQGNEGYLLIDNLRSEFITGGIGATGDKSSDFNSGIPSCTHNDYFVAVINPKIFNDNPYAKLSKLYKNFGIRFRKTSDNPILMFYKLL